MDYDKRAVGYVRRLERTVPPKGKLDFEHIEFGAIFNALTAHVEEGRGHPDFVQAYESLFTILAEIRGVRPDRVAKAKNILRDLQQYLCQRL